MENLLDSNEEKYFWWWANELKDIGFIEKIELQPKPFDLSSSIKSVYDKQLKTKIKEVEETLLNKHIYTTDVKITWNKSALDIFTTLLDSRVKKTENRSLTYIISQINENNEIISYVEVKPSFDQNNMTRLAKINQKWVWEKHGLFVNIVIPEKHFNKTFTPKKFLFTDKSGKPRKIKYKNIVTLDKLTSKL